MNQFGQNYPDQNFQVGDQLEIKIIFSGDAIIFDPDPRIKKFIPNLKVADQGSDPELRIEVSIRHYHVTEVKISSR